MDASAVPFALAERLGPEATIGLVDLLGAAEQECTEQVMTQSFERFERRLVEEISKLRVEMTGEISKLRIEMVQGDSALRHEVAALGTGLRQEMANQRFDLLKWSFLFWIGQVVAIATLLRMSGR